MTRNAFGADGFQFSARIHSILPMAESEGRVAIAANTPIVWETARFDNTILNPPRTGDIEGGPGNDLIFGPEGDGWNWIYGNDGNDRLNGGTDLDFLYGGSGNDHLVGGRGSDYLFGGPGNDILFGGGGRDHFEFNHDAPDDVGHDVIRGFEVGGDTLTFDSDLLAYDFMRGAGIVRNYASVVDGNTVFDFGHASVTLLGISDPRSLVNSFSYLLDGPDDWM
ncbi:calcium-binding protein [Phaeobacter marinintestinus]|uniref:calcium-binding protein n=1 Tax=Falsiphaeobacter marinintestinus TaxID=1492905 RepID=UPI0016485C5F|nr:calcium-binding protein [Phaeobacter marinintestinus]